jgi:transaldolase/glucose-6-phosphate isomerase
MTIKYQFEAGKYEKLLSESSKQIIESRFVQRLFEKDGSLWTDDPSHHEVALKRLGWLELPSHMKGQAAQLEQFASEKVFRNFRHVVHLGMGGSSLAPEVFFETFRNAADFPELIVLDSTDPDQIDDVLGNIRLEHTLFIVASKSGTTIETSSLAKFFYARLSDKEPNTVREHFIAITDPVTVLQSEGEKKYSKVFINPPDIGGRYSALSYFGLVPFAIIGRDVSRLIAMAEKRENVCRSGGPDNLYDGAKLGAFLGKLAEAGVNKMTLQTSPSLATVGWWIEQLVAESTGKDGKGILPVDGEKITASNFYSSDRVFVYLKLRGDVDLDKEEKLKVLGRTGFPVVSIEMDEVYDLGGFFYDWEVATAAAASIMRIDPFDEPNVKESKDNTKRVLDEFSREGVSEGEPINVGLEPVLLSNAEMKIYGNIGTADTLVGILKNLFAGKKEGDYLALMSYFPRRKEYEEFLVELQASLRDRLHIPVTSGFGPRFLHSTGQFHKGGTKNGLFLQFIHQPENDFEIPGESYTFKNLFRAQAIGDYISLKSKGKPVVSIELENNPIPKLKEIFGEII